MICTDEISLAILSAVIGILATGYGMQRNIKKDAQQNASDSMSVKEELKYISKSVDEIKYDGKTLNSSLTKINERLIKNEMNTQSNNVQIQILTDKLERHISQHGDDGA